VALGGGVFQNALLLERVIERLEKLEFRVLTHSRVPANDGGISFGQAAIAAARDYARDQPQVVDELQPNSASANGRV
jgi:hydrogenase maturation protein HypF